MDRSLSLAPMRTQLTSAILRAEELLGRMMYVWQLLPFNCRNLISSLGRVIVISQLVIALLIKVFSSGTVNNIEIFRALLAAGFKPTTPVEIHWYSGEEAGLLGSQAIATSYAKANAKVKAFLELDMTVLEHLRSTLICYLRYVCFRHCKSVPMAQSHLTHMFQFCTRFEGGYCH